MTPGATRFVMTSESAVSRPIMPKGASSNSAFFSKSLCGAWSVTMASTVPSFTPSTSASLLRCVRKRELCTASTSSCSSANANARCSTAYSTGARW